LHGTRLHLHLGRRLLSVFPQRLPTKGKSSDVVQSVQSTARAARADLHRAVGVGGKLLLCLLLGLWWRLLCLSLRWSLRCLLLLRLCRLGWTETGLRLCLWLQLVLGGRSPLLRCGWVVAGACSSLTLHTTLTKPAPAQTSCMYVSRVLWDSLCGVGEGPCLIHQKRQPGIVMRSH
jgi:hypothetical protein